MNGTGLQTIFCLYYNFIPKSLKKPIVLYHITPIFNQNHCSETIKFCIIYLIGSGKQKVRAKQWIRKDEVIKWIS